MEIGTGTELIDKYSRQSTKVTDIKQVSSFWSGWCVEMYCVNGKWIKRHELTKRYWIIGADPLPEDTSW